MGIVNKKQDCAFCKHCDGFACLKYDVWLDGKIRGDKKKDNYIPVLTYGKKYCKHFKKERD